MQSPTIIAGLRRLATSPWLHFVAYRNVFREMLTGFGAVL